MTWWYFLRFTAPLGFPPLIWASLFPSFISHFLYMSVHMCEGVKMPARTIVLPSHQPTPLSPPATSLSLTRYSCSERSSSPLFLSLWGCWVSKYDMMLRSLRYLWISQLIKCPINLILCIVAVVFYTQCNCFVWSVMVNCDALESSLGTRDGLLIHGDKVCQHLRSEGCFAIQYTWKEIVFWIRHKVSDWSVLQFTSSMTK